MPWPTPDRVPNPWPADDTGAIHLNKPIAGMESTPDGHGCWLYASDGGRFPFGDAAGFGSLGATHF